MAGSVGRLDGERFTTDRTPSRCDRRRRWEIKTVWLCQDADPNADYRNHRSLRQQSPP